MACNIKLLSSHPSPPERRGAGKRGGRFKLYFEGCAAEVAGFYPLLPAFSLPLLVLGFSSLSNQGQGPYQGDGGRRASRIG